MYGGFLLLGGLGGLIVGFLGSGIFLMIYRAVKHASGNHEWIIQSEMSKY